jgi:two-component system phosphate regulon sensor histidine kinase PhoR
LTAPLGAIKWSIEALKDPEVPISRKGKLLSSVYSQATILVHLIKNFALMSNLDADLELGQFREQPENIDCLRLVINLANDFQPQAHEVGLDVKVDNNSFTKVFGAKLLQIEKNMVSQAVSNIIENAVKYSDRGGSIKISAVSGNRKVGIQVESMGIPITHQEKEKLFERGFRGQSAKQKVPAGTGIGLYLASRVMKFHGGSIEIDTQGRLSRFIFLFPSAMLVV